MTIQRDNSVFGVIVSGVTKDDAIARYLEAVNGSSVAMYTSKSGNFGILSESGTHLYNPITASADMEESDDYTERMLASYSGSADDDLQAHYTICSNGCAAHIVASDNLIMQFCPVCASELDDTETDFNNDGDTDLNGIDDDLENFDTSYEEESGNCHASAYDYDDDFESECGMSDDEIDDYAIMAGISFSEDDDDFDFESDDSLMVEEDTFAPDDNEDDLESPEYEAQEDEAVEPVEEEADFENDEVLAMADSKEDAVSEYATMCLTGAMTKHQASVSSYTFYSASNSEAQINFDPSFGDPNLESYDVLVSTTALNTDDDIVAAHYYTCSSAQCSAHIVSSKEGMAFCPSCSADVVEPNQEIAVVDQSETTAPKVDLEKEDDSEFDFGSINEGEEDAAETDRAEEDEDNSNEKALSRALSFVAGDKDVSTTKLNVAFCGSIDGLKSWVAFYNGQPIAKATSESAAKHQAMFEDPSYQTAVMTGAEHLGVSKILDEMGFRAVMSSVEISNSLKTVVNKHFKDKMSELTAKYAAQTIANNNEYREKFSAALATAAVGINRGFFKGFDNPVKSALASTLSAAGVRNSEGLLDDVFKSHSDAYHKIMFEKALEIVNKPEEIQNEIAIAVSESNYMSEHKPNSAFASANVENRLSGIGNESSTRQLPTNTAVAASNTNVVQLNNIKSVIAGLGR